MWVELVSWVIEGFNISKKVTQLPLTRFLKRNINDFLNRFKRKEKQKRQERWKAQNRRSKSRRVVSWQDGWNVVLYLSFITREIYNWSDFGRVQPGLVPTWPRDFVDGFVIPFLSGTLLDKIRSYRQACPSAWGLFELWRTGIDMNEHKVVFTGRSNLLRMLPILHHLYDTLE